MLLSKVCDSVVNYFSLFLEESRETNERTPAAAARGPGAQETGGSADASTTSGAAVQTQ